MLLRLAKSSILSMTSTIVCIAIGFGLRMFKYVNAELVSLRKTTIFVESVGVIHELPLRDLTFLQQRQSF